jgi:hypothetical protein
MCRSSAPMRGLPSVLMSKPLSASLTLHEEFHGWHYWLECPADFDPFQGLNLALDGHLSGSLTSEQARAAVEDVARTEFGPMNFSWRQSDVPSTVLGQTEFWHAEYSADMGEGVGVREPRRPQPSSPSQTAEADLYVPMQRPSLPPDSPGNDART